METGALQLSGQKSLSLTTNQQEGAPRHQGALDQPDPNPAGSVLPLSLPGDLLVPGAGSVPAPFIPAPSRAGRADAVAGWPLASLPMPALAPAPPSCLPGVGEQPRSCPLQGTWSPSLMGYSSCPGPQGLFPNGLTLMGWGPLDTELWAVHPTFLLPVGRCGRTVPHCWMCWP